MATPSNPGKGHGPHKPTVKQPPLGKGHDPKPVTKPTIKNPGHEHEGA